MSPADVFGTGPQFTAMRDLYIKDAGAIMIVTDITSIPSLNEVPDLMDQIRRVRDEDVPPVLLVANKLDLDHTWSSRHRWTPPRRW